MTMVFHNSRNRRAPFSDFKDSKLAALLINVKKSKERGHDPNDTLAKYLKLHRVKRRMTGGLNAGP